MNSYLKTHLLRYPRHELMDEIKFLYHSAMGGGHLVSDDKDSLEKIIQEIDPARGYEIQKEDLNDQLCYVHFGNLNSIQARVLNRLFIYSAKHTKMDKKKLKLSLEDLKKEKTEEERKRIDHYIAQGMPIVSHSVTFKENYHPAYRIVDKSLMHYFDLFDAIEEALVNQKTTIIGIDGRCGSGKSTLAKYIKDLYGIEIIAMDDFFLPIAKRTPARLAEVGGNIDYERFVQEVKQPLKEGDVLNYRIFDCHLGAFNGTRHIPQQTVYVIEGSYCMHPVINDLYDLRVFMTIPREVQRERILARNGEKMYLKFEKVWIPMEEDYFKACDLMAEADFIYDNSLEKGGCL